MSKYSFEKLYYDLRKEMLRKSAFPFMEPMTNSNKKRGALIIDDIEEAKSYIIMRSEFDNGKVIDIEGDWIK